MQTINRNNQTITLSTTPTHLEELNEFSIAVLDDVFDCRVNNDLLGKALKYTETNETVNLIHSLGGFASEFIGEFPPLSEIKSSYKQSILAQNKILKKCRQVQTILMSKGDAHAKCKYINNFDEIYKISEYPREFVNCVLNNTDIKTLVEAFTFVDETPVGIQLIAHFSPYNDEFNFEQKINKGEISKVESLNALNRIIEHLELGLRNPFEVCIEPLDRSNKAIMLNKLKRITEMNVEIFYLSCKEFEPSRLARIILPLAGEQQEFIYKSLPKSLVRSIKVELKKQETKLFTKLNGKLKGKSENEVDKLSKEWEERLFLNAYRPLSSLEKLINQKEQSFKGEGVHEQREKLNSKQGRPFTFNELTDFKDDSIRKMLRGVGQHVLEHAFYYFKDDKCLQGIYKIVPSLKATLEKRFTEIEEIAEEAISYEAQDQILHFLEAIEVNHSKNDVALPQNMADEPLLFESEGLDDDLSNARIETIAVFDKGALEDVLLCRDATGENGAEVIKEILDKGPERKVLYGTEQMLEEVDKLFKLYPNFSEVLEEIKVCVMVSMLNGLPLEFPIVNLQGLPGIGKTAFMKALCDSLSFEFYDASIASMGGKMDLVGGSHQFKSAGVGEIAKALLLQSTNYQFGLLLDELCLAKTEGEHSLVPSLLGLLDLEQRKSVKERYLDVTMDCSGIFICTTTNNLENVLPALRSRLTNFNILPPNNCQMHTISNEIYKTYLQEKNLTKFFNENLSKEIKQHLEKMVPREAKSIIISSVKRTLIRSHNRNTSREIVIQDVAKNDDFLTKTKAPIGFIH